MTQTTNSTPQAANSALISADSLPINRKIIAIPEAEYGSIRT